MREIGGGDGVVGWRTWSEFVVRGLGVGSSWLLHHTRPASTRLPSLASRREADHHHHHQYHTHPPHTHTHASTSTSTCSPYPHPTNPPASQPLITNSHLITQPHHPHPAINHHLPTHHPSQSQPKHPHALAVVRDLPAIHTLPDGAACALQLLKMRPRHMRRAQLCLAHPPHNRHRSPATTTPDHPSHQPHHLLLLNHPCPPLPSSAIQSPLIAHQHSVLLYPDLPHTSPPLRPVLRIVLDQARAAGQLFFAGRRATSA